jgi:hypothetical protein
MKTTKNNKTKKEVSFSSYEEFMKTYFPKAYKEETEKTPEDPFLVGVLIAEKILDKKFKRVK